MKNLEKNAKRIDILLHKFNIPADEYPSELVELKKSNTINFFVSKYVRGNKNDPEYKGLDKIEDLLEGETEYLVLLCCRLWA